MNLDPMERDSVVSALNTMAAGFGQPSRDLVSAAVTRAHRHERYRRWTSAAAGVAAVSVAAVGTVGWNQLRHTDDTSIIAATPSASPSLSGETPQPCHGSPPFTGPRGFFDPAGGMPRATITSVQVPTRAESGSWLSGTITVQVDDGPDVDVFSGRGGWMFLVKDGKVVTQTVGPSIAVRLDDFKPGGSFDLADRVKLVQCRAPQASVRSDSPLPPGTYELYVAIDIDAAGAESGSRQVAVSGPVSITVY